MAEQLDILGGSTPIGSGRREPAGTYGQGPLFDAPQTIRGQLAIPAAHDVRIRNSSLSRGGNAYCETCGWEGSWRPTCIDAAEDAENHRDNAR